MFLGKPRIRDFDLSGETFFDGNFSRVYQGVHKSSGKTFAVKVIDKAAVKRISTRHPNVQNEVMQEKQAAMRLQGSALFPTLWTTFQDDTALYFVYDWVDGGELWSYLMDDTVHVGAAARSSLSADTAGVAAVADSVPGLAPAKVAGNAASDAQGRADESLDNILSSDSPSEAGDRPTAAPDSKPPKCPVPIDLPVARCILRQLVLALQHMHGVGLAHRDLKPENIMVAGDAEVGTGGVCSVCGHRYPPEGSHVTSGCQPSRLRHPKIVVVDFGTCKDLIHPAYNNVTSDFGGTPDYMPPEAIDNSRVFEGDDAAGHFNASAHGSGPSMGGASDAKGSSRRPNPTDTTTDLWSLGCIAYRLLVGTTPFKAASAYLSFERILAHEKPQPPTAAGAAGGAGVESTTAGALNTHAGTAAPLAFPACFPSPARDFICSLLRANRYARLGVGQGPVAGHLLTEEQRKQQAAGAAPTDANAAAGRGGLSRQPNAAVRHPRRRPEDTVPSVLPRIDHEAILRHPFFNIEDDGSVDIVDAGAGGGVTDGNGVHGWRHMAAMALVGSSASRSSGAWQPLLSLVAKAIAGLAWLDPKPLQRLKDGAATEVERWQPWSSWRLLVASMSSDARLQLMHYLALRRRLHMPQVLALFCGSYVQARCGRVMIPSAFAFASASVAARTASGTSHSGARPCLIGESAGSREIIGWCLGQSSAITDYEKQQMGGSGVSATGRANGDAPVSGAETQQAPSSWLRTSALEWSQPHYIVVIPSPLLRCSVVDGQSKIAGDGSAEADTAAQEGNRSPSLQIGAGDADQSQARLASMIAAINVLQPPPSAVVVTGIADDSSSCGGADHTQQHGELMRLLSGITHTGTAILLASSACDGTPVQPPSIPTHTGMPDAGRADAAHSPSFSACWLRGCRLLTCPTSSTSTDATTPDAVAAPTMLPPAVAAVAGPTSEFAWLRAESDLARSTAQHALVFTSAVTTGAAAAPLRTAASGGVDANIHLANLASAVAGTNVRYIINTACEGTQPPIIAPDKRVEGEGDAWQCLRKREISSVVPSVPNNEGDATVRPKRPARSSSQRSADTGDSDDENDAGAASPQQPSQQPVKVISFPPLSGLVKQAHAASATSAATSVGLDAVGTTTADHNGGSGVDRQAQCFDVHVPVIKILRLRLEPGYAKVRVGMKKAAVDGTELPEFEFEALAAGGVLVALPTEPAEG